VAEPQIAFRDAVNSAFGIFLPATGKSLPVRALRYRSGHPGVAVAALSRRC